MSETINAETRIGALLEAHPETEAALVDLAPAFKALRNPLLRRTVARVATVAQAAQVAGMPVPDLVTALRRLVGQELACDGCGDHDGPDRPAEAPPAWLAGAEPAISLDAGALMADGRTPVAEVLAALGTMAPGAILLLVAPFRPQPLVEAVAGRGHEVYVRPSEVGTWEVWVRRS